MTMSREESGRIGGLKTLERHGRNHFSTIGKSPKPRDPTLAEILERNPELIIKDKGGLERKESSATESSGSTSD